MKENENIKDTDLDLDALSEVNGGMCRRLGLRDDQLSEVGGGLALNLGGAVAYCKACGKRLKDLGTRRIMGGSTNIFVCTNTKCKEYNKEKNNLEVVNCP